MRVLVALGGNALSSPDGRARPEDQLGAADRAAAGLAELVVAGHDVVVTHGIRPMAASRLFEIWFAGGVDSSVPRDWCVAQAQATISVLLADAREQALRVRGVPRPVTARVSRTL